MNQIHSSVSPFFCHTKLILQNQMMFPYLTSYWGRQILPQDDDVGAGAGGMAGESWRVDESHPGALKEWRYPGCFHLRLHCCLQLELPRWAHTTRRSPPRDSSDTLLVRSDVRYIMKETRVDIKQTMLC